MFSLTHRAVAISAMPKSCGGGPRNSATMMLPSRCHPSACAAGSGKDSSKMGSGDWNISSRRRVRYPCATLGQERSKKSWRPKTQRRWRALSAGIASSIPRSTPSHGEVSVNEDRFGTGEWRVEYFDDDGGCYVTIFAGPAAERRARDYFISLKSGRLRWVRADSTFWGDDLIISCTACRVMRLSSPATHRVIAHL